MNPIVVVASFMILWGLLMAFLNRRLTGAIIRFLAASSGDPGALSTLRARERWIRGIWIFFGLFLVSLGSVALVSKMVVSP